MKEMTKPEFKFKPTKMRAWWNPKTAEFDAEDFENGAKFMPVIILAACDYRALMKRFKAAEADAAKWRATMGIVAFNKQRARRRFR